MIDPLFWLGLSILLVAVSLTAVLVAALPALQELARAARSVEKLADTLRRELPPTLEAIRLTGLEISDLTDDISEGVKSAGQVVKQVDQGISGAKNQVKKAQVNTRGVFAGVKAAWKTWRHPNAGQRAIDRLPPSQRAALEFDDGNHDPMTSNSQGGNEYRNRDTDFQNTELRDRTYPYPNSQRNTHPPQPYEDLEAPEETADY
ncbi:MAG TPA: DUF948 domain-containing protein [Coleofasciculaceae cyanobacterium]